MTRVTGGQQLVASLRTFGVDTVFGIPGIQLYDLVDALYDAEDISFVLTKHEQSTSYMADGYARVTGKPGVAMVVPGPGVLNATAGLSTAYACSSPVLLLAGQVDSSLINAQKYGALHELPNQTELLQQVCKWVGTVKSAAEIPDLVSQAFFHMLEDVPGPVALEIPPDILAQEADFREPVEYVVPKPSLDVEVLERIRATIAASRFPYILAGGGVSSSRADREVLALAESLGCPVIQTRNGRGSVDATHPLVLDPHVRSAVAEKADLVIVLGSRMGTGAGGHAELGTERIISINADPAQLVHPRPRIDVPIVGDVKQVLQLILEFVHRDDQKLGSDWDQDTIHRIRSSGEESLRDVSPQLEYLSVIERTLPTGSVFVSEYTQVGYVSTISYPAKGPGTFISPGYQGTLGYGFATAIGAQVAAKGERVVAVTGDGGFAWTMPELATLHRYQIPLITVIFNDGRYGNVYRSQKYEYGGREMASSITNPDFQALASAHHIESHLVETPAELQDALNSVLEGTPRPVVIEVRVDEFPSPWNHIDETT